MNVHQRNYVQARALMGVLQDELRRRTLPFDVQVEAGTITEDEWADAYERLEEELGLGEARRLRLEARTALIEWGRSRLDALWPQFAHLFADGSEAMVRRVFETPRAADRLAEMLLRLDGGC